VQRINKKMLIGDARVSTSDQTLEPQKDILIAEGWVPLCTDL